MDQAIDPLATVEDLLLKSFEISSKSDDVLLGLFTKSFQTATVVFSETSDDEHVMQSLESLEYERLLALQMESTEFNAHRYLSFALVKCLQVTLLQLRGKNNAEQNYQMEMLNEPPLSYMEEELIDEFMLEQQVSDYEAGLFASADDGAPEVYEMLESNEKTVLPAEEDPLLSSAAQLLQMAEKTENMVAELYSSGMVIKEEVFGGWTTPFKDQLVETGEKRRSTRTRTPNKRYRDREEDMKPFSSTLGRIRKATSQSFKCTKCSNSYYSMEGLRSHAYRHNDDVIHCGCKSWVKKVNFARHAKICPRAAAATPKKTTGWDSKTQPMNLAPTPRAVKMLEFKPPNPVSIPAPVPLPSPLGTLVRSEPTDISPKMTRVESMKMKTHKNLAPTPRTVKMEEDFKPTNPLSIRAPVPSPLAAFFRSEPTDFPMETPKIGKDVDMTSKLKEVCTICAKTLHNKSHREYHMRLHTGETPFACPHCSLSFRAVSILNKHIRTVHGLLPYECGTCKMQFELKSELQLHLPQHKGHDQLQQE